MTEKNERTQAAIEPTAEDTEGHKRFVRATEDETEPAPEAEGVAKVAEEPDTEGHKRFVR